MLHSPKCIQLTKIPDIQKRLLKTATLPLLFSKEALLRTVFIPTFSAIVNTQENEALT